MPMSGWHDHGVNFTVLTREDGQINAAIAGDHPVLNDALADSISSLPS